jgi:hypothetical protein
MIDWAKYCPCLVDVDVAAPTCNVEPGIALDVLNAQLAQYGLGHGPEPATKLHAQWDDWQQLLRCHRTADRQGGRQHRPLEVMRYDGTRFWCGEIDDAYVAIERRGDRQATVYRQLRRLRDDYADEIRSRFPEIPGGYPATTSTHRRGVRCRCRAHDREPHDDDRARLSATAS